MKRLIKSVLFFLLYYTGIEWLLARLLPVRAAAVLMYHGVCDQASLPPDINFHLPRREFEQQMRALKSRYRIVSIEEIVRDLAEGRSIEKSVVITFDDGYRNNAQYAAPVLQELGLPYIVYAATSYVGTAKWTPLNELYWLWSEGKLSSDQMKEARKQIRTQPFGTPVPVLRDAERPSSLSSAAEESFTMLSWEELIQMASNGAEFGSHTHTHCNMAVESDETQKRELLTSKSFLEDHLGNPVKSFAYPFGRKAQMSEAARSNIIAAGYTSAISAEYGLVTSSSDRFCIPRLGYERPIWRFTGEILYQFAKQAWRERRRASAVADPLPSTEG